MKNSIKAAVDNKKNYKSCEEIEERIKKFFNINGETLAKDELERTVRAYIYLTDDRIPVDAVLLRKDSK